MICLTGQEKNRAAVLISSPVLVGSIQREAMPCVSEIKNGPAY